MKFSVAAASLHLQKFWIGFVELYVLRHRNLVAFAEGLDQFSGMKCFSSIAVDGFLASNSTWNHVLGGLTAILGVNLAMRGTNLAILGVNLAVLGANLAVLGANLVV